MGQNTQRGVAEAHGELQPSPKGGDVLNRCLIAAIVAELYVFRSNTPAYSPRMHQWWARHCKAQAIPDCDLVLINSDSEGHVLCTE